MQSFVIQKRKIVLGKLFLRNFLLLKTIALVCKRFFHLLYLILSWGSQTNIEKLDVESLRSSTKVGRHEEIQEKLTIYEEEEKNCHE